MFKDIFCRINRLEALSCTLLFMQQVDDQMALCDGIIFIKMNAAKLSQIIVTEYDYTIMHVTNLILV